MLSAVPVDAPNSQVRVVEKAMQQAAVIERTSRPERKNFILGVMQGLFLHAGSPFIHATTILPTFLFALSGSHALCGFVLTIKRFSQIFPQLWGARYINEMQYKKSILIGVAAFRSACWAVIAGAALIWGASNPVLFIGIFFVFLTLFYVTGGIGLVAFNDFTQKVIHQAERGAFFGWRGFLGGASAVATALVARWVLSSRDLFPHPLDHATLFLLASLFIGFQVFCVLPIDEPPNNISSGRVPLKDYIKELSGILRSYSWFRTLVLVKLFLGGALLATPFYVVYATDALDQPLAAVGTYTLIIMLAKASGDLLWGKLADRFGHGFVLIVVGFASILPHLLAFFSGIFHPLLMYGVFFSLGLIFDSKDMLVRNYLLEQSPEDRVPVFSALLNTLSVPIMVFPLIGALTIRLAGYQALFLSAMAVTLVGIIAAIRLPERQEVFI